MEGREHKYPFERPGMPRIEDKGGTYFLNFSLLDKDDKLSECEREAVFRIIAQGHGPRYCLFAVAVMPTHVHLVLLAVADDKHVPLPTITHHIKGFSAYKVNQLRGRKGALWLPRSHNRLLWSQKQYRRFVRYIIDNPRRGELVEKPDDYPYLWYLGRGPLPFV
jgi:REP element-mobilizing transposase RayT